MRASLVLPMLVAVLLVAGCNPGDGDRNKTGDGPSPAGKVSQPPAKATAADTPPAQVAEAGEEVSVIPPSDWPSWLPVYAGSDVVKSESVENEFGSGISAELLSGDDPEVIADFYLTEMKRAGFYLRDTTISPIEHFQYFLAPSHDIQIAVIHETEVVRILLEVAPAEPFEGEYPPYKETWVELNKLQPGFPVDLLPMQEMTRINSSILTEDGMVAVVDFLSSATIVELDEYYSELFTGRGWRRAELSRSETACNVYYYKDGMQIGTGIGKYADGQVFASLAYEPEMSQ